MNDWTADLKIDESTTPPFDQLNELNLALNIVEEVGPRCDTGKKLELLDDSLFNGPRLRSAIDGVTLPWIDGTFRLQRRILELIPVKDDTAQKRLDQFARLQERQARLAYSKVYEMRLSDESAVSNGLVFVKAVEDKEILSKKPWAYCYAEVSEPWALFFVQLGDVHRRVKQLRLRCLRQGRVFCFTEAFNGWQMHAPDDWLEGRRRPKLREAKFLLTRDLPVNLLYAHISKAEREERKLKAKAMRWLYNQYAILTEQGSWLVKEEALSSIGAEFGIKTRTILNEVWVDTPILDWRKPGRRKKKQVK